ncbi:MAG: response regulator transcription factor [Chloroflexi bacterium]|jgi:DNA-binding response OmpR family regulator|nr:response regulator transcription factor [Chloroflexota bacterium]
MGKIKILLVDDDPEITESLAAYLQRSGFDCSVADNGLDALRKIENDPPHLVVCDVIMPHMDGREFLRSIRERKINIPVIMLTRIGSSSEKVMTLNEGADDYINKPFDPLELVARIQAVLRRSQLYASSLVSAWVLAARDLTVNRQRREIYMSGKQVHCTQRAFCLLEYMITHPDEVLSRERLQEVVWGWENAVDSRAVDNRIGELRRLLGDDAGKPVYIETVPQSGYRFLAQVRIISS